MQNATIRDTVTKTSADLPGPLRELLDKTPIGHLTPPEVTKQGVEMVALCEQEADHRRYAEEAGNPRQDVSPRNTRRSQKAYLQEIRKAAMIEYR